MTISNTSIGQVETLVKLLGYSVSQTLGHHPQYRDRVMVKFVQFFYLAAFKGLNVEEREFDEIFGHRRATLSF